MSSWKKLIFSMMVSLPLSLPSTGQITFASRQYALNNPVIQIATGDFNGDGKPDVAVFSILGGTVSILLNNGDGSVASPRDFPAITPDANGSTTFSALAVGDFNGDKNLDVIVAHSDHSTGIGFLEVLLGNGDGTLRLPIATPLNFYATYFFGVGDFNGDKKQDLAVYGADPNTQLSLITLLGNEDGTFTRGSMAQGGTGFGPTGALIADLNHDGKLDVLFSTQFGANWENNDLLIFLGRGDGTFRSAMQLTSQAPATYALASGDFNHDGTPDLVSCSYQAQDCTCEFGVCHCRPFGPPGSLAVMLGKGDGTFGGPGVLASADFRNSVVGDFDADGNPDFIVEVNSGLTVYLGDGRGGFSTQATSSSSRLMNAKAADFNGDGLDDLIALNFTSSSTNQGPDAVEVSLNTTPGFSLQASSSSQQIQPGGSATYTINVGQQNGFSNPVALGCSAPAGVHCSLSSASVRPGNSITMMVTTTANSASAVSILAPFKFLYAFYMPLGGLVSIGFAARGRKTRRISSVMLGGVIFAGLTLQVACGGGSPNMGGGSPQARNYAITVTGTSGTTQHSTTVNLTVQ